MTGQYLTDHITYAMAYLFLYLGHYATYVINYPWPTCLFWGKQNMTYIGLVHYLQ